MFKSVKLAATLGAALMLFSVGAKADLITNGSFETTTGYGQIGWNGNTLNGWTTNGYNFLFPSTGGTVNGSAGSLSLWSGANGLGPSPDGGNYIGADGAFEVGAYIPAYIRRYPFVLANDQSREQLVVCIDRAASMLSEDYDLPFFNESGEPTDYTNGCIQFCNDFETEGRRTESFVSLLRELDLFEVSRSTFTPANPDGTAGAPQPIAEFFAVSEAKLKALPPEKLMELVGNGAVAQVYAHMMSLAGWDRLIARALARQATEAAPANMN